MSQPRESRDRGGWIPSPEKHVWLQETLEGKVNQTTPKRAAPFSADIQFEVIMGSVNESI